MESALIKDASTGKYLQDGPAQFNRIPQVGELVQLDSEAWEVSAVSHSWDAGKQPLCELSLSLTTVNRLGGRAE
ncbi:MAG: hypothetical protein V4628_17910 [Pseudomonadota bacterium]